MLQRMRRRVMTVAGLVALASTIVGVAICQTLTEPLMDVRRPPAPDPIEIVHNLQSIDIDRRIEALREVGVDERLRTKPPGPLYTDFTKVDGVRLIYASLDDGPALDAIVIFKQGPYDQGVIFRRESENWHRVALFNCWCKYERDPLAQFIELRRLVDLKHDDLIVRDSLGGTGVYWRDAVFYRMQNGTPREVLRVREEESNCNTQMAHQSPTYCEALRSTIFYPGWMPNQQAIVVTTVKGREPVPPHQGDFYPPLAGNLVTSVPAGCKAYIWKESAFHFVEDAETTALYCRAP